MVVFPMKSKISKAAAWVLMLAAVPLSVAAGAFVFRDRSYIWVSLAVVGLSCGAFFLSFERGRRGTHRLVILAALTALSVVGRSLFAPIPFFKPVTAVVIICGMELGAESGFVCGAMSAFISNFIFMQGPWTPFQMFIWGIIGFFSGALSKMLKKHPAMLLGYGVAAGIMYSLFMDIWTTVWYDGIFMTSRYLAAAAAAVPITAVYCVSNVIFLALLARPIGKKLERLSQKYGI